MDLRLEMADWSTNPLPCYYTESYDIYPMWVTWDILYIYRRLKGPLNPYTSWCAVCYTKTFNWQTLWLRLYAAVNLIRGVSELSVDRGEMSKIDSFTGSNLFPSITAWCYRLAKGLKGFFPLVTSQSDTRKWSITSSWWQPVFISQSLSGLEFWPSGEPGSSMWSHVCGAVPNSIITAADRRQLTSPLLYVLSLIMNYCI